MQVCTMHVMHCDLFKYLHRTQFKDTIGTSLLKKSDPQLSYEKILLFYLKQNIVMSFYKPKNQLKKR